MFFEKVPLKEDDFFVVRQSLNLAENYPFHTHPEYELIVVLHASGRRFVGNAFSDFKDYDMALIGPNLPHRWSFEVFNKKSRVLVLQFKGSIMEDPFFKVSGLKRLQQLLSDACCGIEFLDKNEILKVEQKLTFLIKNHNLDSLIEFLNVLSLLSQTKKVKILSTQKVSLNVSRNSMKKIDNIFNYIFEHSSSVSLDEISEKFFMSKSGFCIFFKKHTGKNFSNFLNEVRINSASKLLLETDMPVSDICYKIGYNNLSYFNRIFKEIQKIAPVEYRKIN